MYFLNQRASRMAGDLKSNYVKFNPSGGRSRLSSLIIDTISCKNIMFYYNGLMLLQLCKPSAQSRLSRIGVGSCCGRTVGLSCALDLSRLSLPAVLRILQADSASICPAMKVSMSQTCCRAVQQSTIPLGTSPSAPPLRGEPHQRRPAPDMLIHFDSFLSYVL